MAQLTSESDHIPVLLLKTRSTPADSYEEYFSSKPFTSTFVPVLEHRSNAQNLDYIRSLLAEGRFGRHSDAVYGGMIFTSQRAVESFTKVVGDVETNSQDARDTQQSSSTTSPSPFPLYVVGPDTSRTLSSLLSASSHSPNSVLAPLNPQIAGAETGNGEALAHYMLQHYNALAGPKLPLLFFVGEQRRDIIPKTLMGPGLTDDQRIQVDELVVYETGVMDSFAQDFNTQMTHIQSSISCKTAVVVVFSPSGCEAMLRCLGLIDENNKPTERGKMKRGNATELEVVQDTQKTFVIATIGPTTRDYLRKEFDFNADVCAEKPSPEGVGKGVKDFLSHTQNSTTRLVEVS